MNKPQDILVVIDMQPNAFGLAGQKDLLQANLAAIESAKKNKICIVMVDLEGCGPIAPTLLELVSFYRKGFVGGQYLSVVITPEKFAAPFQ